MRAAYDEAVSSAPEPAGPDGWATLGRPLWSALEGDLFRFASDRALARALDAEAGGAEWLRFARLNELYRSIIKALVPWGVAPPGWTAALRGIAVAKRASRLGAVADSVLLRPRAMRQRLVAALRPHAVRELPAE